MLLAQIGSVLLSYWYLLLPAAITVYCVRQRSYHGLNKYPGPFLASLTDLWRAWDLVSRRNFHEECVELHRKHGDVVRVGPNLLSFADPRALKDIYGLNKGFVKSGYYPVQAGVSKGHAVLNLFSSTDEEYHAKFRRCVNHAFSMSTLLSYEPLVNSTTAFFLDRTAELYASTERAVDFPHWLQFYAFDVIGELSWSKRLGFLDNNKDIDGIINTVNESLDYTSVAGQAPWVDRVLLKNPVIMWLGRRGLWNYGTRPAEFATRRSKERLAGIDRAEKALPDIDEKRGVDFLTRFLQAQKDHPEFMDDTRIMGACLSLIFAGSDSTAASFANIFYNLLKNPSVYAKLMSEIDAAVADGKLYADNATRGSTHETFSYESANKLPYLDAVITEAFRIHPPVGIILERIVPSQGATIAGRFVPGGTNVGCNAWVLHRRPEIFGADVDTFRPERWLESEGATPEKIKEMRASMFHFGAGSRTCIGRNISLLEIYKTVPSFLSRFEIAFANPSKAIKRHNAFFIRMYGFDVRIRDRRAIEKA